MDSPALPNKRWSEMDREEKLQYQRDCGARHREKKRRENPPRKVIDTPEAEYNRDKAKRHYHLLKGRDEEATLAAGRQHQADLRLKRDGGPIGRLIKNAVKNVLQPYKEADQRAHRQRRENKYRRDRYSEDDVYRFRCRLRVRLVTYLRTTGNPVAKEEATLSMVMKPVGQLLEDLEEASGLLVSASEVDHIFPLSRFNLALAHNVAAVMHWSNLQLLTSNENKWKNDRLPTKAMAAKVDHSCWPDGITVDMLPDIYPGWATPLRMHLPSSSGAGSSSDHAAMGSSSSN